MDTLRIRITLNRPMAEPKQAFHLDALLSALHVARLEEKQGAIDPRSVHHDLPLERYTSPSGKWVFKASAFQLERSSDSFLWMTTGRSDLSQVAEDRASGFLKLRKAKVNPAGGFFKSSMSNTELVWANLTAWVVGDKAEIEQLLAGCDQVGGRRGLGFGNVASIAVESVPAEECKWDWRALPDDYDQPTTHGESLCLAQGNLKAPYWDRRLYENVLVPTSL